MFKVAMQDRWLVVVNTPELIEEVRKLSGEQANFIDAAHEVRLPNPPMQKVTYSHIYPSPRPSKLDIHSDRYLTKTRTTSTSFVLMFSNILGNFTRTCMTR